MIHTRRTLAALLPTLLVAANRAGAQHAILPSRVYPFEDLPVKNSGPNQARQVLNGKTHDGFPIELHSTELPPGGMPHSPHHHVHEEMILVQEGTLEVSISGNKKKIGAGSVAYVASNEEHGWQNVGATPARYFVIALGRMDV